MQILFNGYLIVYNNSSFPDQRGEFFDKENKINT